MTAAAQNDLPFAAAPAPVALVNACLVCQRPIYVHWTRLCVAHEQMWRHGPEYGASPAGRQLRAAMRDLIAEAVPGKAQARLMWLLAREEMDADPAALTAYVARVHAEDQRAIARKASVADDRLEAEVQEEVVKALRKLRDQDRLDYERINAGGHYNESGQYVRSAATGIPDLLVWVAVEKPRASGGKAAFSVGLGLECKRPGGKQSDAQAKWEAKFRKHARGFYCLVTSGAEAIRAVECAARLESPQ
jgi:hypothetical protein